MKRWVAPLALLAFVGCDAGKSGIKLLV